MCFPVFKCYCCINLKTQIRIIAILNLLTWSAVAVLYSEAAWAMLPTLAQAKSCAYLLAAGAACYQMFFSILLTYRAFWAVRALLRITLHLFFDSKSSYLWSWLVMSWLSHSGLVLLVLLALVLLALQFADVETSATEISAVASFCFLSAVLLYYSATVVNGRGQQLEPDKRDEDELIEQLLSRRRRAASGDSLA